MKWIRCKKHVTSLKEWNNIPYKRTTQIDKILIILKVLPNKAMHSEEWLDIGCGIKWWRTAAMLLLFFHRIFQKRINVWSKMSSASTDDKLLYCKSWFTVIMEDSCLHTILIENCCQVECGINAGGYSDYYRAIVSHFVSWSMNLRRLF